MKNKFSMAISLAVILAMLVTSLALADNVQNDVAVNYPGGVSLVASDSSSSATVGYYVHGLPQDGDNGCNIDSLESLQITITPPSGVTASPSSVTFTACDQYKYVTFTAAAGALSGEATISITSNNTGSGSYNLNPAKFDITVTTPPPPADTTLPVISYVLNPASPDGSNGWYVSDVTLTWTVSEPESSDSLVLTGCVDQNITADQFATDYSCSASSDAGSAGPVTVTIKRDATAPVLSLVFTPDSPDGSNGWWKTPGGVPFAWTCSEATSGIDGSFDGGCPSSMSGTVTAQGTTNFADQVKDMAGNLSVAVNRDLMLDNVAPNVAVTPDRSPDHSGWYNAPVVFDTVSADATSGVLDANCTANQTYSGPDDLGLTVNGSCTDNAGNVGSGISAAFDFDDTNPTLTWNIAINDGDSFYFGFVPVYPPNPCVAADNLSGPDSCNVTGYDTTVGPHILTATAYDVAGNSYSETRSYTVLAWTLKGFYSPVDMNGVFNVVKGGSTVPLKFEVFAGQTELTSTSVVMSFVVTKVACDGTATLDDIELTTTGGTSLRYDTTAGQFIQNWQTPKLPGQCYRVTMTTQDLSTIVAYFKLK